MKQRSTVGTMFDIGILKVEQQIVALANLTNETLSLASLSEQ
jgi:hypothetical protein